MSKSRPSGERASGEPHAAGGRYALFGEDRACPTLAPGLYIVATPIGHLSDITLRALETLAAADLIACEDTRVTSKLLGRYAIVRPLLPYHEHNAAVMRPRLLAELQAGRAVALVSDAGTPLISDPGYRLVREAQAAGHSVTAIAALVLAGLPTDRFFFEGFLPPREAARRARIAELAAIPATLIVFETGPRLQAALADLAAGLGAREAAVCRELTKLHEEVRRGTLPALADDYAQGAETRGEFVIVIAPPLEQPGIVGEDQIDDMLRSALASASLKDAVEAVTAASGQPRRLVYQRALALAKERGDGRD